MSPVFSLTSDTLTPGSSTALLRSRWVSSAIGMAGLSKYLASGHTRTRVPDFLRPPSGYGASASITSPPANTSRCTAPSRHTTTSRRVASALVTDTPTPCRPPENAYAPPPCLSNLPPACRRVKTSSTTGAFSSGCRPTGIPRPSSSTEMLPSPCSVT
ncbi:Uncharacterised protein [Bordetella pertussis]|nr:Uncharacterised protein [Bordetella pertussis]